MTNPRRRAGIPAGDGHPGRRQVFPAAAGAGRAGARKCHWTPVQRCCAAGRYANGHRNSTTSGRVQSVHPCRYPGRPQMPGQPQVSPDRSQPARRPRREAGSQDGPGEGRRRDVTRPLPDPVAIRLCRVPDTAPPYDDEAPGEPESGPGRADALAAAIVAALEAGDRPRHSVRASAEGPPTRRRPPRPASAPGRPGRVSTARQPGASRQPGAPGRPGAAGPSPQPGDWPSKFAQVLAETLAGSRPPAQLAPWTTERALSHIRKLGPLLSAGQQPLVQRVITSAPTAGVVEMSVVVGFGPRVRALAVRLERAQARPATAGHPARQARWLCTTVEAA